MGTAGFRHEAVLYAGTGQFVEHASRFLAPAVSAGEPVLVMTDDRKAAHLRRALGDRASTVAFADMADLGRNPARIIPAWRDFADTHAASAALWGIGEPAWAGRTPAELVECRHHEALVNLVFADCSRFTLLCPYDVAVLPTDVIEGARSTHPTIHHHDSSQPSAAYTPVDGRGLLAEDLPRPPDVAVQLDFGHDELASVRRHVERVAVALGLTGRRVSDMVLAVDEVATNSQRHGGGGVLTTWVDAGNFVCEVRDRGRLTDPLVGRRYPPANQIGGRGLWIVNQVCDLVQIRSSARGTVVRVHTRVDRR
ncbi:MAG TPA: sensor histidine kinase [Acidimicrobiales bacterium]